MPRNTGAGAILGGLAFLLGFALVWHIWWLAIACASSMLAVIVVRTYDDDGEYCLPAGDVEKIEQRRYRALASSARTQTRKDRIFSSQPLPESLS
jgi:cytochrome o ubiquinol oxidase subunit 1